VKRIHRQCESANRPQRCSGNRRADRTGVATVEFVLVASAFFMILFAAIEFCVLCNIRNTANNAAYEAARKLVIPGANAETGRTEAQRIMNIIGAGNMTVTVIPETITYDTKEVTVRLEIPYARNAILMPTFTGDVTVTSEVTLATERYDGMSGG
jgi:Flp pilus assembly protein TadG